jgi:hypothetical protein
MARFVPLWALCVICPDSAGWDDSLAGGGRSWGAEHLRLKIDGLSLRRAQSCRTRSAGGDGVGVAFGSVAVVGVDPPQSGVEVVSRGVGSGSRANSRRAGEASSKTMAWASSVRSGAAVRRAARSASHSGCTWRRTVLILPRKPSWLISVVSVAALVTPTAHRCGRCSEWGGWSAAPRRVEPPGRPDGSTRVAVGSVDASVMLRPAPPPPPIPT